MRTFAMMVCTILGVCLLLTIPVLGAALLFVAFRLEKTASAADEERLIAFLVLLAALGAGSLFVQWGWQQATAGL